MAHSMKRIRKAVLPVAGLGTRFLPATKAVPKEMLCVVDRPVVQHVVDDARAAGIEHFVFVTGRNKAVIEDHFDIAYELNQTLESRQKTKELEALAKDQFAAGRTSFTRQQEPLGLGHAVWCAREIVGDEPFAVILPDMLSRGSMAQMIGAYEKHGHRGLEADWNALCDPIAAAAVFAAHAPVHRSTPLDVTLQVQLPAEEVQSRFDSGLLAVIRQLDAEALSQSMPIIFHDPLTAAAIFDDELCRFERGRVEVGPEGRTHWHPDADGPHEVAFAVDVERYFREHLSLID